MSTNNELQKKYEQESESMQERVAQMMTRKNRNKSYIVVAPFLEEIEEAL